MSPTARTARRPQAERSAASTDAMLQSAVELMAEHGARVSMMAIGRKSGFSHGLVLARFGSKAGLIRAVTSRVQRRFTENAVAAAGGAKGLAALNGLVDTFFRGLGGTTPAGRAFYVLLGEAVGPDPELKAAFTHADATFRAYVQNMLEEARHTGELAADVSPAAAAALLVGMLRGVALQLRVNPDAFDPEPVHREARAFVARLAAAQS